jgi:hypothetical protein
LSDNGAANNFIGEVYPMLLSTGATESRDLVMLFEYSVEDCRESRGNISVANDLDVFIRDELPRSVFPQLPLSEKAQYLLLSSLAVLAQCQSWGST